MTTDNMIYSDPGVIEDVRPPASLRSKFQRTWIARSRAKKSDCSIGRALFMICVVAISLMVWTSADVADSELRSFWLAAIESSDYVGALIQVERLAVARDPAVNSAVGECAAHLLAIVEGSNYTDHLLRASCAVASDKNELGRAVNQPSSFNSSEALRVVDEGRIESQ